MSNEDTSEKAIYNVMVEILAALNEIKGILRYRTPMPRGSDPSGELYYKTQPQRATF